MPSLTSKLEPPFSWDTVAGIFAVPVFDVDSMRRIFAEIGAPAGAEEKLEAAAFQLSEIAKSFAYELWRERKPSAAEEEDAALRLAAACENILMLTGVGCDEAATPDSLLPSFGPGGLYASAAHRGEHCGRAATISLLRAVRDLRTDALQMAEVRARRQKMRPRTRGRRESFAIKHLVSALSHFYLDVWDEPPAVARSNASATSGDLTGRFVGLLERVNAALIDRGLKYYATPESLVHHWRTLEPWRKARPA